MNEIDLTLALQLQAQFEEELRVSLQKQEEEQQKLRAEAAAIGQGSQGTWRTKGPLQEPPQEQLSVPLTDPSWELIDPNPDIRTLFLTYNDQFFWGRLAGVEVKWGPRMTLCAGLCSYEGHGGLCSVRLSLPLLKLRPRKDLVETLLHEMIHAYLFVTANNRDREGHGPEFHKHMYRINSVAGTNITVYHTFHDEVDVYRQHIWQCDGPCRSWRPYFGLVKRSMNRAPGPRDPWWERHRQSCGGTYTKIQEPKGYGEAKKGSSRANKRKLENCGDIRKFVGFTGQSSSLVGADAGTSRPRDRPNTGEKATNKKNVSKENIPDWKNRTGSGGQSVLSESKKKQSNVQGMASTASGTVSQVKVTNASNSNVHGFGGHSPAWKKPHRGVGPDVGKVLGGGGAIPKTGGGFDTGLAVRGGGSRTVTVKGKAGTQTESQVRNTSNTNNAAVSYPAFQGQGHTLGGAGGSGFSRLLSLSVTSQLPTASHHPKDTLLKPPVPQHIAEDSHRGAGSEEENLHPPLWVSRSPAKRKTPQKLQQSLDCYLVSPSSSQPDQQGEETVKCPVCGKDVPQRKINKHLDKCIGSFSDDDMKDERVPNDHIPAASAKKELMFLDESGDSKVPMEDVVEMSSEGEETKKHPCPVCGEPCSQATINQHLDTHF